MGEEKPDEELMGKRKSSPRLSTTFDDVDNLRIARLSRFIHRFSKKENSWRQSDTTVGLFFNIAENVVR